MLPEGASACDFCLKTCTDFAKTFQQAFQTPGGHDHKKIYAAFSQAGGPPDQQCNSGQRSRMVKDGQSMSKYVKVKFQNVSKIFRLSWRLKRILTWEAVHQPLVLNCLWRAVDCEIRHALLCPRERMRYIKSVLQVSSPKVQKYPKVEIVTPCKVILVKTLKASEEVAA